MMGWLWATPSPPKPSTPLEGRSTNTAAQSKVQNEPVDPEIQKFFDLFLSESSPKKQEAVASPPSEPSTDSAKSSSTSSASSWLSLRTQPSAPSTRSAKAASNEPLSPLSESLLPTDMSCRQAFDLAWSCNSLGGQFNAIYRYGEMRSCSEQWDDFWFCMRTKSHTGEMREKAIQQHYREKERRKYYDSEGAKSSEDVWQSREFKAPSGSVFNESIDIAIAGGQSS